MYPLTVPGVLVAVLAGALTAVGSDNLVAGLAVTTLLAGMAITLRRDELPVVPFVVAYQWTSITVGYWYSLWTGIFPGSYRPGDVEQAVTMSLAGLLLLAAGIRLVQDPLSRWFQNRRGLAPDAAPPIGDRHLKPMFTIVVLAYAVDYVFVFNAREMGSLASIAQRVLELRQVLLITLWVEVLRLRRHLLYLPITLVIATIPRLGAYYSDFKTPLILMLLALAATWRPWQLSWWPRSLWALVKSAPVLAALIILILVWQGGLKNETRQAYDGGFIGNAPRDRIEFFVDNLQRDLPTLFEDPQPFVETLVERLSYITFFSLVLDYVPKIEPHADGELLQMAMLNAFVPRALFPEKPALPSDSYYTRRFAGVAVSEKGTSVSIGYMAEFYADWGLRGMFLSILGYGCWIGAMMAVVARYTAVPLLRVGTVTVTALAVADFEHQFIKGFAALNTNVLVLLVVLLLLRPWLLRILRPGDPAGSVEVGGAHSTVPAVR